MTPLVSRLKDLSAALQEAADREEILSEKRERLRAAADRCGDSWSGSWLGYQSRVYYEDYRTPPPGARFSIEWGLRETFSDSTVGRWHEYAFDETIKKILKEAEVSGEMEIEGDSSEIADLFEDLSTRARSLLSILRSQLPLDVFVREIEEKCSKIEVFRKEQFVEAMRPKRMGSRDAISVDGGFQSPPHILVLATVSATQSPYFACGQLSKLLKQLLSHLEFALPSNNMSAVPTGRIFIGHGRSKLWKELKEFIFERLNLDWDEYNRESTAGIGTSDRLKEMLDSASFAFLILTAEDEHHDGTVHGRMNVAHEAGLFQGKLGFRRAIVMLEEGCEEFSNIVGLGQIRFKKGDIASCFEEVRRVLEREGIL